MICRPNIPGSYAMLFCTASDFISITSHIHNCALLSLWLRLFILSGVISPLFSISILGTYRPGEFIFRVSYLFAFSYCSWSTQDKNTEVVCHSFPSPVDHVLSELSTMTHPSWVALHAMAHSFTELDKAVIDLISFL